MRVIAIRDIGFTKTKNTKYCSELRNLPVVSIEEGQEIGVLNSFLIDPDKRKVTALVLSTRESRSVVRVVPFEAVVSFGSFALTISRSSCVSDIAANPYYVSLFEKDIMLLGAEVRGGDDNLLGFVKDFGIDYTDGTLLSLRLTSDSGFLSPYQATIPFTAVEDITPDMVRLSPNFGVEFKKDTPFSDSGDVAFVPLVTQDVQLKQLVGEGLRNEIDRLRTELRERIFEQHDEYFVKRQKGMIERSLTESLTRVIEERVAEAVTSSERDMSAHITAAIEAFFESEHLKRLYEYINKTKADIAESISSDAQKRAELLSQAVDLFNQKLADSEKRTAENAERAMRSFAGEVNANIAANKNSLDEKTSAEISAAARELKAEAAAWILEIEKKFSALENNSEKLAYEYNEALDTFRSSTKSEWSSFRKSLEDKAADEWQRISRELETISERSASEKGASETLYAELRAALNTMRDDFRDELAAKLDDLAQSQSAAFRRELNNALASSADRFNALLSERVASSAADLRKRIDSSTEAAAAEAKSAAAKIDSLSEDINSAAAAQSRTADTLSAQIRAAVAAIENGARDIAALSAGLERSTESAATLKDEVESLSANTAAALRALEDRIEASASDSITSSVDKSFSRVDEHVTNILRGFATKDDTDRLAAAISNLSGKKDHFDAGAIEKLEQRIAEQAAQIESLTELVNKAGTGKKSKSAAVDADEIARIVERVIADKSSVAAPPADAVTQSMLEAELAKLRSDISASENSAQPREGVPEAVDGGIMNAIESRLSPLEDNWTVADQSLADMQRAADYQSDRLDTVEDNIASIQNSIDALNTLLRGTETRLGRLRDEVFSLGEVIKSNAAGNSENAAHAEIPSSLTKRIASLEEQLSAVLRKQAQPAGQPHDASEQFEWVERNLTELAEKMHALEKTSRAAGKPADEERAKKVAALEQKVSSFEMILPAVTDFFKDSGIRESVNAIRTAQERADRILPEFEKKISALETGLSEAVDSISKGQPPSPGAPGEPAQPAQPVEVGELKSAIESIRKSVDQTSDELKSAIEAVERLSREHTSSLVDTVQHQFDSALEDLSTRIETRLMQLQEEASRHEQPHEGGTGSVTSEAIAEIRAEFAALSERIAELSATREPSAATEASTGFDEEQVGGLLQLLARAKDLVTRDEAMQMQDDVVQDAIIQIDARFAGVAMESDLEKIRDAFRKQLKEKIDSMRDLVFDAFEGKIDEIKSFFDADRISRGRDD